jgi:hypothetical protein
MKSQYRMLFVFIGLLLAVSLACSGGSTAPTAAPVASNEPASSSVTQPPAATNPPASNAGSSDIVTFTDGKNLLAFDLPGDWVHKNNPGDKFYTDIFTSPDGTAKIESLVYNDGTAFSGQDNGKFALYLLNTFYSKTGKEGDIHISEDKIQPDGSEKLTWTSSGGGYSGVSFFELRGDDRKTFLMFTLYYSSDAPQAVLDVLDKAITTYKIP